MAKRPTLKSQLENWRTSGKAPPVDPYLMYREEYPRPDVRAVLMLASAMAGNAPTVSMECQVAAAEYYNEHGLSATLDEIVRRGGRLE